MRRIKGIRFQSVILILIGITCGTLIGTLLTSTFKIGFAFGLVTSIAPHIYLQRKIERERITLQKLWPEILDHIISGLNSGLSLTQTLAALGQRGPVRNKAYL
jgi:tight adherence protein B